MKDSVYLVLTVDGVQRMTKRPPRLLGNERAVKINVEVEDSIFEYTFLRTDLKISEDDMLEPSLDVQVEHLTEKI